MQVEYQAGPSIIKWDYFEGQSLFGDLVGPMLFSLTCVSIVHSLMPYLRQYTVRNQEIKACSLTRNFSSGDDKSTTAQC